MLELEGTIKAMTSYRFEFFFQQYLMTSDNDDDVNSATATKVFCRTLASTKVKRLRKLTKLRTISLKCAMDAELTSQTTLNCCGLFG